MQKFTGNIARDIFHFMGVLALLVWSGFACADIIDDINLKTGTNGDVEAIIRFTVPIQNLRYAKQQMPATFVAIYFNILDNTTNDQWQNIESHRSPPSDLIPGFTVTTHDLNLNPKIEVLFNSSADFTLKAGRDGRSLVVHIKSNYVKQEQEAKPVAAAASVVQPAAAAVTTAAALAAAASPSVAAPTPSVAAAAKAKPTAANAKPVAPPATPAPAASPVIAPAPAVVPAPVTAAVEAPVVAPPSLPVPIPKAVGTLGGGKDGLPAFPKIDEVTGLQLDAQPVVGLTLAEQIKRADSQAALQMAVGRNAILTGDMNIAVESFNNVLKLSTNKYTQDAQVWIGIAREKSGQPYKAVLEYDTYTKLYPNGASVAWAKNRLTQLKAVLPDIPTQQSAGTTAANAPHTAFQTTEYGSLSMYYYTGSSKTDTVQTVGAIQTPTSLTSTDQSSLLSNVNMTARSFNNVYDNRLVFQEFNSTNFLQNQPSQETLNAFYYDVRNRVENYSARIGRQSASGGGVMGRFDGANAGYGITQNTRVNVVAGQLSDKIIGPKPVFFGASVDLGVRDTFGGSVYAIKQTVSGLTDREAVGGYARYAAQGRSVISQLDYDVKIKGLNTLTLQGTQNGEFGMDYNFLLDHRRTPMLDLRNSVIGSTASVDSLLQYGMTQSDLIELAKLRTATSNVAMLGANKRVSDKWQAGADITASITSGMPASGTLINPQFDPTTGLPIPGTGTPGIEGYIPATGSTGVAWTTTGRVIGNDVFTNHDISIGSMSYTRSQQITGEMFLLTNHSFLQEKLTMDSTLRLYLQTDINGGKQNVIAPVFKFGYRVRNSLTVETEEGLEWTKSTPSASSPLQASTTLRKYFSLGGRWDF